MLKHIDNSSIIYVVYNYAHKTDLKVTHDNMNTITLTSPLSENITIGIFENIYPQFVRIRKIDGFVYEYKLEDY